MAAKVIAISGGSRGLGLQIVHALLDSGYIVATFSREKSAGVEALCERDPSAETFFWQQVDASEKAALKEFVLEVFRRYHRLDGLINNAAIQIEGLFPMVSDEAIHSLLSVNLEGVFYLTRAVTRVMLTQKRSNRCIINIGSVVGQRGFKGTAVYAATKSAIEGLTRSLARELGSKGIRVMAVLPGFMDTDMTAELNEGMRKQIIRRTPLGRLGTPRDVTGLVGFLLSEEAQFITGQSIVVDGGLTC